MADWVITIMLPVTSSPPANTTKVSATPNTAPMASFASGEPAATRGAPTLSSSTTAMPTKAPANAAANR